MNKTIYIYGLIRPQEKNIRYVGKSVNPKRRLYQHIFNARNNKPNNLHLLRWIKKIINDGLLPEYIILEECNKKNWKEKEKYWIKELIKNKLCNRHEGGIEPPNLTGYKQTAEHRKNESIARKGKPQWIDIPHPLLGKYGNDNPNYGRKRSKEFCELMRKQRLENNGMKGVKLSKKRIKQIKENNSKGVALIDDKGNILKKYQSHKEAEKELNLYGGSVGRVCSGEYRHTKGYKFKRL